eukprot:3845571-Alexandrium_andersonii.AAC.1
MSASLVGSEMCIRDSFSCAHQGCCRPSGPPSGWRLQRSPPEVPLGAVSYTHLTLPTICSV